MHPTESPSTPTCDKLAEYITSTNVVASDQPSTGATTVPATPTRPSQPFLYSAMMGGGDSHSAQSRGNQHPSPSLHPSLRSRFSKYVHGRTPESASPTPVMRRKAGRLVRAAQAPIPLSQYPSPPRPRQGIRAIGTLNRLLAEHALPTDLEAAQTGTNLLGLLGGDAATSTAADGGFSATIALAVYEAVKEVITSEELGAQSAGTQIWEHICGKSSVHDKPGTAASCVQGAPAVVETSTAGASSSDGASGHTGSQTGLNSGESSGNIVYVPPSSPVVPLMHGSYDWQSDRDSEAEGQAIVSTLEPSLLSSISTFNPLRPTFTHFELLMRLGADSILWPVAGVTRSELRRLLRACALCSRFMYAERRAQHRCDGDVLDVRQPNFDLVQTMLSFTQHSGVGLTDLALILFRCEGCSHIFHVRTAEDGNLDHSAAVLESAHRCPRDSHFL